MTTLLDSLGAHIRGINQEEGVSRRPINTELTRLLVYDLPAKQGIRIQGPQLTR